MQAFVLSGPGAVGARRVIWPERSSGSLGVSRLDEAVRAARINPMAILRNE